MKSRFALLLLALLPMSAFAVASGIEGTPSMVVNGKYRVTARSMEDMLRVTDFLVAKERARK